MSAARDQSPLFRFPDADVVLLSGGSDATTEFHVHRRVLSLASPFFRDMFSLPQDPSKPNDIPRIPVAEPAPVLEKLLQLVYPMADPVLTSLEELKDVLGVAVKYDFEGAVSMLRAWLITPQFLHSAPVRVYAIACRYELEDEAKVASRYTLGVNLLDVPLSDELKWISAYHYHQLLVLHKRRAQAALGYLKDVKGDLKCMQCNGSNFHLQLPTPPKWWTEYEARAREELSLRPTTDVIFRLDFLYKAAAKGGCPRCPGSVLESWKFLMDLKNAIDDLPSTI
ncbi:hypothetical protein CC1G_10647 [Coprinopsis cinerea okayama7|uniref:BTB domain-containing protein n=1 Tax=Coprinopsis cinerea (strain Okayama-7 / 130 / ATCC MYA-4618 / FGSC 9003) TaxID=240176 RepID=A8P648_COPC7|nr:hypothetical protein CC1G_10647 [Coprinopsis cinerea okayama7\|eukprot:XP_001839082.1 hypothetical protein CC1G_10647 [Coprinopsis cinerea okayama7\